MRFEIQFNRHRPFVEVRRCHVPPVWVEQNHEALSGPETHGAGWPGLHDADTTGGAQRPLQPQEGGVTDQYIGSWEAGYADVVRQNRRVDN